MLKIRVMNISKKDLHKTLKKFKGAAWDQSPHLQEAVRRRVRPARRRALTAAWWATTTSTTRRPTSSCSARWRKIAAAASRPVHRGAAPSLFQMESWQELSQPARSDQDLHDARIRRLALAARVRRLHATSASPCRGSWRGGPTAPRPTRSRSSTSRRTRRRPTTASTPGPTPPTRWRSTSTARSSCTAGARGFAASNRAAPSKACRRTRSRPTTAAST